MQTYSLLQNISPDVRDDVRKRLAMYFQEFGYSDEGVATPTASKAPPG